MCRTHAPRLLPSLEGTFAYLGGVWVDGDTTHDTRVCGRYLVYEMFAMISFEGLDWIEHTGYGSESRLAQGTFVVRLFSSATNEYVTRLGYQCEQVIITWR